MSTSHSNIQRRLKRASGANNKRWPLISWLVALSIFSLIVLVSRTPSVSSAESSGETDDNRASRAAKSEIMIQQSSKDGDVIVECILDTPHDNSPESAHGTLHITVLRSVSPLASNAFLHMIETEHFNECYLFRVVKGFINQWGIESPHHVDGERSAARKFDKVDIDPPVKGRSLSNTRGTLNFAGGNAKTGQVYVNKKDNHHLDKEKGSLPFAMLDDKSMKIIDSVYDGYKEGSGQVKAVKEGADAVQKLFPKMSRIERCWVVRSNDSIQ
jgi:cyclophilin family peptidyl-prolyl cis-trans isomerase